MLALIPCAENPAADYLSRLEVQPEDRLHLKVTDSLPVFHVEIDIASKTPKQEEDKTDYHPHDEADGNIRKRQSNTPDNELSGQTEQEQPTPTEKDSHQMTAHGAIGHRKTSVEDQMTFIRVVNTSSLPPRAMSSISLENMVNLQVVQENNGDIQKIKSILSDQQAPPTHVKFESQFFQKFHENIKRSKVKK